MEFLFDSNKISTINFFYLEILIKFLQYFSPPGPEEEYRNWPTPNEHKINSTTSSGKQKEEKVETNIIVPTARPIPGSPQPLLGSVHEIDTNDVSIASDTSDDEPSNKIEDKDIKLKLKPGL